MDSFDLITCAGWSTHEQWMVICPSQVNNGKTVVLPCGKIHLWTPKAGLVKAFWCMITTFEAKNTHSIVIHYQLFETRARAHTRTFRQVSPSNRHTKLENEPLCRCRRWYAVRVFVHKMHVYTVYTYKFARFIYLRMTNESSLIWAGVIWDIAIIHTIVRLYVRVSNGLLPCTLKHAVSMVEVYLVRIYTRKTPLNRAEQKKKTR